MITDLPRSVSVDETLKYLTQMAEDYTLTTNIESHIHLIDKQGLASALPYLTERERVAVLADAIGQIESAESIRADGGPVNEAIAAGHDEKAEEILLKAIRTSLTRLSEDSTELRNLAWALAEKADKLDAALMNHTAVA
jgi:hypothetical protein